MQASRIAIDGGELGVGQPRRAERARRLLGSPPAGSWSSAALRSIADAGLFSSWASPADSFPSETIFSSCRLARGEDAGAIEHAVDEDRRDLMTLADHRGQVVARHGQDLRGLLGDRIARRADQAGIRKQTRDVALPPLHDLVPPGAAIDEDGDAPRQHDEQAFHRRALRSSAPRRRPVAGGIPCEASHASSSRGAAPRVLCCASRSTRSVAVMRVTPGLQSYIRRRGRVSRPEAPTARIAALAGFAKTLAQEQVLVTARVVVHHRHDLKAVLGVERRSLESERHENNLPTAPPASL